MPMTDLSGAIIQFANVQKSFDKADVLKNISFDVDLGNVISLIGRSGSGKSTLLRCVNGLEQINSGELVVCGRALHEKGVNLRELRTEVGIVFQSFNLFPHLSVVENIMLAPRKVKKLAKREARELAMEALEQVGLAEKHDAYPDQLSGGQQQRVAIARSLAMRPRLMLFDEVTSSLDPELTAEVLKVIAKLASEGMTMLLVTHEMNFARSVGGRVLFMHHGEIWESGSGDILANPKTPELANFVASGL